MPDEKKNGLRTAAESLSGVNQTTFVKKDDFFDKALTMARSGLLSKKLEKLSQMMKKLKVKDPAP